jgi:hypothetical protein
LVHTALPLASAREALAAKPSEIARLVTRDGLIFPEKHGARSQVMQGFATAFPQVLLPSMSGGERADRLD